MNYAEMKPLHGPGCNLPEDREDALGPDIVAELDGQAAGRHNIPPELNPYEGFYAELWEKGRLYILGLLPFQQ